MPRAALEYVQFPLGDLTKEEVRSHARRFGLPNADKPESQEICFVPDGDYASFVERRAAGAAPIEGGDIVDEQGTVLGSHAGVHHFTIGQRRGLRVAAGEPRYVIGVDALTRRVTVGPKESLDRPEIEVEDLSLCEVKAAPIRAEVQVRYRHVPQPAWIHPGEGRRARVVFDQPERAPAPGQAAVFYQGEVVLGGGFII
jgi:tRNA-specific 2-thiouridylase